MYQKFCLKLSAVAYIWKYRYALLFLVSLFEDKKRYDSFIFELHHLAFLKYGIQNHHVVLLKWKNYFLVCGIWLLIYHAFQLRCTTI